MKIIMNITSPRSIYILLVFTVICLFSQTISAQNGRMLGLVNNELVEIDLQTGDLTFVTNTNIPAGVEVTNLAFAPISCLYYGIINPDSNPTLVSISWGGNYNEVGEILLPIDPIYSCKALAFNDNDNILYASVSMNDDIGAGVNTAESIVGLNSTNGEAFFKTTLSGTVENDIDDMVFINNFLYFNDADDLSTSNFYVSNFGTVGATMTASLLLSTPYIGSQDLSVYGDQLFITTADRGFYKFDTNSNSLDYIDETHATSEYNGAPIVGLDFGAIELYYTLMVDTTICDGQSLSATINVIGSIITWSDGQTGNTINITEPGDYWADIFIFNCISTSDTIHVEVEDCGPCALLYNSIKDKLDLGADTTICDFHELEIGIDLDFDVDVVWNTGQTGTSITVNEPGTYEATVFFEDCEWPTSVFTLETEPCDTCIYVELAVEEELFLGNDVTICLGDEHQLDIDLDDTYNIVWNNGETGLNITITEPGTYQASITTELCMFDSDSIVVSTSVCERPCEYFIPNAFSPQGDTNNDIFKVYFGTATCTLVEIELLIFDRWGGFLFKSNENEWDGKIDGRPIGVGTYTYLAKMLIEQDGELKNIIDGGDVTVFR